MIEKLIYKNNLFKLSIILIATVIATLMSTCFGILLRFIIDNHSSYNNSTIAWLFICCFVLIRVIMPVSYSILKYTVSLFVVDREKYIRDFFFNLIKNMPFDKLSSINKNEMVSAYNISISAIASYINVIFLEFIPCLIDAIFISIIVSYYIGVKFGCVIAFVIISYSLIVIKLVNNRAKSMKQSASSYKKLNDIFYDVIANLESAKIFRVIEKSNTRYKKVINSFVSSRTTVINKFLQFGMVISLVSAIFCLIILYYAKVKIDSGLMSIGELVMIANYLFYLFIPLTRACASLADYKRSKIDFKLIEDFFKNNSIIFEVDKQESTDIKVHVKNIDKIEFILKNLKKIRQECTINYQDQKIVLEKNTVSFLTGRNGIGKSTLAKIISQIDLEYDGNLITNYNKQKIKYVHMPQKMVFINDSILNNILHYTPKTDAFLFKKLLNELNFTKELDFIVGNNGDKLSGGEKQKLAITIALLNTPNCLILGEPTNSIDVESVNIVSNKIKELSNNIIVLIISHNTEFIDLFTNKKIYNIDNAIVT